jgi:glycosyltransferase involved in cell wall biosynthesis
MNILIALNRTIPVIKYGGTERVFWCLGKELVKLGHNVTFLVPKGSYCDFAKIIFIDSTKHMNQQIPEGTDVVHISFGMPTEIDFPHIVNMHVNINDHTPLDINTVFVSANHAAKYGSDSFVHNGLDWNEYKKPVTTGKRDFFHFLGKAAWRVKNVKGAIKVVLRTKDEKLKVIGGSRLNISMGFRLTLNPRISFAGMVADEEKNMLLNRSKGLIFPVRWHEPFGLALTESLYFGCPIFGTTYGALPEIINEDVGFLSNNASELSQAILNTDDYNREKCTQYAIDVFNSKKMAESYLQKYYTVISGKTLNLVNPRLIATENKFLPWAD